MLKVILDTNILINALNDKSSFTWQILELAKSGDINFFASLKILKEYQLIIDREVVNETDKQELQNFISRVEVVPVTKKVKAVKWDPEDDKFINAALSVKADYIVSSDSHLLELGGYQKIKILNPKDFYYLVRGEKDLDGEREWAEVFKNLFQP